MTAALQRTKSQSRAWNDTSITEHLPEGHDGREIYGVVKDPTPERGREARHHVTPE